MPKSSRLACLARTEASVQDGVKYAAGTKRPTESVTDRLPRGLRTAENGEALGTYGLWPSMLDRIQKAQPVLGKAVCACALPKQSEVPKRWLTVHAEAVRHVRHRLQ